MLEHFIELSKILTGYDKLNSKIAELYYAKLTEVFGAKLSTLLDEYNAAVRSGIGNPEDLVRNQIWSNPEMRSICQDIIKLWYTASLNITTVWIAPPGAYFEALLWKAIEAHPPGLSGGYFGYWRYAPEN